MQKYENIANLSIFCLKPLAVAIASMNYQCKNVKILPTSASSAWNLSL